jgi:DNA polymerase-3 subunit epsilon
MKLRLTRPIVFFDLETTGIDVEKDKIVEISLLKLFPDGTEEIITQLVNPERVIPVEASKIHGIYELMVANEMTFKELAPSLLKRFEGCDLSGFNIINYDLPLIRMEFKRIGIEFPAQGINAIDPYQIYTKKEPRAQGNPGEPRNLAAAYRFYCNKSITSAHSAEADIIATKEVFLAQIERYSDIGVTVEEIVKFTGSGSRRNVDIAGKLVYNDKNEIVYNFGKHNGKRVKDEKSYAEWMIKQDFPDETKKVLREILSNKR